MEMSVHGRAFLERSNIREDMAACPNLGQIWREVSEMQDSTS